MTKLNKTLIVLLVTQLGVVALTRVLMHDDGASKPRSLFPGLTTDQITSIQVVDSEKETVLLEKRGEQWVLANRGDFPVAKDKVTEFIGKLPGLVSSQVVATKETHHHSLEVSAEKYQRDVTVKAGDTSYQFLLGSSPGIKSVHFRFKDEPEVYLVKDLSAWDVGAAATAWISNEYFKIKKDEIVAATLENASGRFDITKGTEGQWQLSPMPEATPSAKGKSKNPVPPLDSAAIDSFLSAASGIYLQEPVGKESKPEYGLDQPTAHLTLITEVTPKRPLKKAEQRPGTAEGATEQEEAAPPSDDTAAIPPAAPVRKTHTLLIGKKVESKDGARYYTKSADSHFIVLVGSWVAEQLTNKKAVDFLKKEEKKEALPAGAEGSPMPMMGGMGGAAGDEHAYE